MSPTVRHSCPHTPSEPAHAHRQQANEITRFQSSKLKSSGTSTSSCTGACASSLRPPTGSVDGVEAPLRHLEGVPRAPGTRQHGPDIAVEDHRDRLLLFFFLFFFFVETYEQGQTSSTKAGLNACGRCLQADAWNLHCLLEFLRDVDHSSRKLFGTSTGSFQGDAFQGDISHKFGSSLHCNNTLFNRSIHAWMQRLTLAANLFTSLTSMTFSGERA